MTTRGVKVSLLALLLMIGLASQSAVAKRMEGTVTVAGQPMRGATVTLWRTAGKDAPKSVSEASTNASGGFAFPNVSAAADGSVFYLTSKGGAGNAVTLMSVLGNEPPSKVVVNELTTVASVFTTARFIDGAAIRGNALGLRIAAGNAPNLVDPATGGWGKVIVDPLNSTQTTTLANLNTLGSLITAFFTVANDDWRARFFKAATPPSGVDAEEHARGDGRHRPRAVGQRRRRSSRCSTKPTRSRRTAHGARRPSRRISPTRRPTSPSGFASRAAGTTPMASSCSMRRATSGAARTGCQARSPASSTTSAAARSSSPPTGPPLSPPITGFTGMGVDGIGWGTGVALDKVWVTSFNGKIGVMDFNGKPIGQGKRLPDGRQNRRTAGRRRRRRTAMSGSPMP